MRQEVLPPKFTVKFDTCYLRDQLIQNKMHTVVIIFHYPSSDRYTICVITSLPVPLKSFCVITSCQTVCLEGRSKTNLIHFGNGQYMIDIDSLLHTLTTLSLP